MRDIKFRGKRLDNGEWVYGSLIQDNVQTRIMFDIGRYNSEMCECKSVEVYLLTVGQFTGLCDKNGKEIYEGDILHVVELSSNNTLTEYDSPVEWVESGFLVTEPNKTQSPLACFYAEVENQIYPFEIEIIGNIHDKEANK